MWAGLLLNFWAQHHFNGNDLMMALTLSFYGICSLSLVKLYDNSLQKYLLPYSSFWKIIVGSTFLSLIIHYCGLGFTATSLPVALAIAYPPLYLACLKIIPNWKKSDGFEKIFAIIITINSLHFLDFPFLRKNVELAPTGFAIAFIFVIIFTVFFPMFVSIYLERKNILELERKVEKRTQQLSQVKDEKTQLLNVLCHDIATPLMVIDLHFSKMKKVLLENPDFSKSLDRSSFAIERLQGMLKQVKKMAAVEEGKEIIDFNYINATDIIKTCTKIHADQLEKKKIKFITHDLTSDDSRLYGNEQIISNDIVSNFITNSIKFTDEGGQITLTVDGNKSYIKIKIEDTGYGLSNEAIQAIYNNVKKSEKGTKGESGTGLGMSIALFYINKLNAKVSIDSKLKEEFPKSSGTKIEILFEVPS